MHKTRDLLRLLDYLHIKYTFSEEKNLINFDLNIDSSRVCKVSLWISDQLMIYVPYVKLYLESPTEDHLIRVSKRIVEKSIIYGSFQLKKDHENNYHIAYSYAVSLERGGLFISEKELDAYFAYLTYACGVLLDDIAVLELEK